jgi:hypothetical protein
LSRVLDARQVAEFCHGGDGHGELDATQGLERVDGRIYTPGFDRFMECLLETPQAFRVCIDRPDVCLKDHWLSGGRTDHLREPAPAGRTPGGLARIADIMPQQKRVEPELGGLEIPDGVFARPAQIADGFVFDLWNIDGREVPRRVLTMLSYHFLYGRNLPL